MPRVLFTSTIYRDVRRGDYSCQNVQKIVETVALAPSSMLYVRGILGSTVYDLAEVEDLELDRYGRVQRRVTFQDFVLARVEGLRENMLTCEHVRFAVRNPPDVQPLEVNGRLFHNRVREIGWKARRVVAELAAYGSQMIYVPGG